MNIKSFLLLCLFGVSPLALAEPPKPLLWQVSDQDNSIYLLGSFHLLQANDYPLAESVNRAFEDSAKVYFEVSPEEIGDPQQAQGMFMKGRLPAGKTLQQLLDAETWQKLQDYCTKNRIPVATFQGFKPWLTALVIEMTELQKAGLQPQFGLDMHFVMLSQRANKATSGLESIEGQFAIFDNMADIEQIQFLQQSLDDSAQGKELVDKLHGYWRSGDAEGLQAMTAQEMLEKTPQLYQRILIDRNNAWLPQLVDFLQQNQRDNALVVVGSLHLLGEDGLVSLLQKQGYQVARIQ